MRGLRVAVLATLCVTGSCWLAAATTSAGTIRGPVRFTGAAVEPKKLKVTVDHSICGTEKSAEDIVLTPEKGLRNAVVSLQMVPSDAKWNPAPPVQLDQKQCVFVPRVVVAPAGGTVEFLNSDRLLHNLHNASSRSNPVFNRTQPKGRTIPLVFPKPEIVRIDCDLHPWMRAWVVVAEHPFYAVTNEQGEFVLTNVPPGTYRLQVWHESLGTVTRDVSVGDGTTAITVEITGK